MTAESLRSTIIPGTPPNVTNETFARCPPLSVTRVPPDTGPVVGDIEEMNGAKITSAYVKAPEDVAVPPGVVTDTA